ncbi:MAG: ATP-binding protein [Ahrensia sp.]|nr:ATP-binding protein [Ahrensia sp.]
MSLAMLNALPNPVLMLDRSANIVLVNAAGEFFLQSSAGKLQGRSFSEFIPKDSPIRALLQQVRRSRAPVSEYRIDVSSPRIGKDVFVDVYVAPIHDRTDDLLVSLQVRSMAETLDRQLTHRGAARTVTGLAAMLAHEIKNPLAGIRGAAQLLEKHGSADDQALTRLITDETDRIVRLVDRMEVFSDERPVERDPVNIHAVLEQVKASAASGFAAEMPIEEYYDPSLPPVSGNRDQLVQVFLNLAKNACEAMSGATKPRLRLETAFKPGMSVTSPGSGDRISLPIALSISDNGCGIPDDLRAHIFDPFISSKQNGSGLGLALVAKIVGDHGGVISCESKPGATTFTVLLPAWKEAQLG